MQHATLAPPLRAKPCLRDAGTTYVMLRGNWGVAEGRERTRYALLVRLPRHVEVRIEDTYLALQGATKPVMGYHITLLGPFQLIDAGIEALLEGVRRVCDVQRPFRVRIAGLDAFRSRDQNVVLLRITRPKRVIALHEALVSATANRVTPEDERYREWTIEHYVPHVTLGMYLRDDELAAFLNAGHAREVDERFEVTGIWLAAQEPQGPWRHVIEYAFGSGFVASGA